jgi:hypothetical protein
MASIWLTYAWPDNQHRDVDFVAQELGSAGIEVKLDRWNLSAGKRDVIGMTLRCGPPRRMPAVGGVVWTRGEGASDDGQWYYSLGYEPATPTNSYYAFLRAMPSAFLFGQEGAQGQVWTLGAPQVSESRVSDGSVQLRQP